MRSVKASSFEDCIEACDAAVDCLDVSYAGGKSLRFHFINFELTRYTSGMLSQECGQPSSQRSRHPWCEARRGELGVSAIILPGR